MSSYYDDIREKRNNSNNNNVESQYESQANYYLSMNASALEIAPLVQNSNRSFLDDKSLYEKQLKIK